MPTNNVLSTPFLVLLSIILILSTTLNVEAKHESLRSVLPEAKATQNVDSGILFHDDQYIDSSRLLTETHLLSLNEDLGEESSVAHSEAPTHFTTTGSPSKSPPVTTSSPSFHREQKSSMSKQCKKKEWKDTDFCRAWLETNFTYTPSDTPSTSPTTKLSELPSWSPTSKLSEAPSKFPTYFPTTTPTVEATTSAPTSTMTKDPTYFPTISMPKECKKKNWDQIALCVEWFEKIGTFSPSDTPSTWPTAETSKLPSSSPTITRQQTLVPSTNKSVGTRIFPSEMPSTLPTDSPSVATTTRQTKLLSYAPTINSSSMNLLSPNNDTIILWPSELPSRFPTEFPSPPPTLSQRDATSMGYPTPSPIIVRSPVPSGAPSAALTSIPSDIPTMSKHQSSINSQGDTSSGVSSGMPTQVGSPNYTGVYIIHKGSEVLVPLKYFDMNVTIHYSQSRNLRSKKPLVIERIRQFDRENELSVTRKHLHVIYQNMFQVPITELAINFLSRGDLELEEFTVRQSTFFGKIGFGKIDGLEVPTEEDLEAATIDAFTGHQKENFLKSFHNVFTGSLENNVVASKYDISVQRSASNQDDLSTELPDEERKIDSSEQQNTKKTNDSKTSSWLLVGAISGGCLVTVASASLIFLIRKRRLNKKNEEIFAELGSCPRHKNISNRQDGYQKAGSPIPKNTTLGERNCTQYIEYESSEEDLACYMDGSWRFDNPNENASVDDSSIASSSMYSESQERGHNSFTQLLFDEMDGVSVVLESVTASDQMEEEGMTAITSKGANNGSVWSISVAESELGRDAIESLDNQGSSANETYGTSLSGASDLFCTVMKFEAYPGERALDDSEKDIHSAKKSRNNVLTPKERKNSLLVEDNSATVTTENSDCLYADGQTFATSRQSVEEGSLLENSLVEPSLARKILQHIEKSTSD